MKKLVLFTLPLCFVTIFFIMNARPSYIGLTDHKLNPCGNRPNCQCSEITSTSAHYIAPVLLTELSSEQQNNVMASAIRVIENMGGNVITQNANYLHATFQSRLFRFIDDFELRVDPENNRLHIRSASRVGYSDMGVNKKRIDNFKRLLLQP